MKEKMISAADYVATIKKKQAEAEEKSNRISVLTTRKGEIEEEIRRIEVATHTGDTVDGDRDALTAEEEAIGREIGTLSKEVSSWQDAMPVLENRRAEAERNEANIEADAVVAMIEKGYPILMEKLPGLLKEIENLLWKEARVNHLNVSFNFNKTCALSGVNIRRDVDRVAISIQNLLGKK